MNRFLVVLLLLVIVVAGLGFYLGWFQLSTETKDDKSTIEFTIDKDKVRKDTDKTIEKVKETEQSVKERTGAKKDKTKE